MTHDPLELWLVRHGETTRSAKRQIAGWINAPLTDRGREQARALQPLLNGHCFTAVWSSDLERAVTTSRLAWGEPHQDRRLRELNFGALEGIHYLDPVSEATARILAFRDFAAPSGESVAELRSRVHAFLDELVPGRHLIFTHGGVIRVLTQDLGVDRFVPTGTAVGVDWRDRRLLFVREPEG